jgi:rhodanese-related sulfurtransferase
MPGLVDFKMIHVSVDENAGVASIFQNLDRKGADIAVIDVREADDYRKGHVPGAINLPHDKWGSEWTTTPVVLPLRFRSKVICTSGPALKPGMKLVRFLSCQ